ARRSRTSTTSKASNSALPDSQVRFSPSSASCPSSSRAATSIRRWRRARSTRPSGSGRTTTRSSQKVAQYYYYPGWWEGGAMLHNFINAEKWNSLPKNYQSLVKTASTHAHEWMQAKYDAGNPAALKRLVAGG